MTICKPLEVYVHLYWKVNIYLRTQVTFQDTRPNHSIENISVKVWTFQSRLLLLLHTFHPTSEWPPSNSKSWMEVISVRFHVSQHDSRVSVFCPFSREVASWIINLPSCRHCLNVVDWNSVEMIIEMNPGEGLHTEKSHNIDFPLTRLYIVEIILELGQKTSIA